MTADAGQAYEVCKKDVDETTLNSMFGEMMENDKNPSFVVSRSVKYDVKIGG